MYVQTALPITPHDLEPAIASPLAVTPTSPLHGTYALRDRGSQRPSDGRAYVHVVEVQVIKVHRGLSAIVIHPHTRAANAAADVYNDIRRKRSLYIP